MIRANLAEVGVTNYDMGEVCVGLQKQIGDEAEVAERLDRAIKRGRLGK